MLYKLVIIGLAAILSVGCASNKMEAEVFPGQSLENINSLHVVKLESDERGIDKLIVNKLKELGKEVSSGTAENAPANIDAKVSYIDKWMWDITMYMIELTIIFQEPKTDMPIAKGYSMHTSLTRKSPEEMVDEVITNIYNAETNK